MSDEEQPVIHVHNVESEALKKIIDYVEYHDIYPAEEIEKPLRGKVEDVICDWDKKFLEMDYSLLIELIMASNYLDMKNLLDLTCAKIANLIKGKSPEQIKDMFGIENDFTPEEEEKIREENRVPYQHTHTQAFARHGSFVYVTERVQDTHR